MERGVAVATSIDINAVVGQIDKYHTTFRCYRVLDISFGRTSSVRQDIQGFLGMNKIIM